MGIHSRTVIVTGAAHGLGRAMTVGVLAAGHRVLAVDADRRGLSELKSVTAGHADRLAVHHADLTAALAPGEVVDLARTRFATVDVIVNNAGVGPGRVRPDFQSLPISFQELSPELVRLYFEVNVLAPLRIVQAARAAMLSQGWGRIVSVTTSLSTMLTAGLGFYGPTKAAFEAMTSIIAGELEGTGVTANVLIPGGRADTGMIPTLAGENRATLVPAESMVSPLLWLISPAADAVNGQRIRAAAWPDAPGESMHRAMAPIGWPTDAGPGPTASTRPGRGRAVTP